MGGIETVRWQFGVNASLQSCICLITGNTPLAHPPINFNQMDTDKMLRSFL